MRVIHFTTSWKRWLGLRCMDRPDRDKVYTFHMGEDRIIKTDMMLVSFPVRAFWVDKTGTIMDATTLTPTWFRSWQSDVPCRYLVETAGDTLDHLKIGDKMPKEVIEK